MFEFFFRGHEIDLLIDMGLSLLAGFLIGIERESKGKPAGISTHSLVIGGSMIFTYLSAQVDPNSTSRIASQLVTGIGFLGAGIILKGRFDDGQNISSSSNRTARGISSSSKVINLTTAASIWFSAAIGMAIGFSYYFMAIVSIAFAVLVPRIPSITKKKEYSED
jgi:putative Mg2+ transporter-C (MgtC) family protein